MHIIFVIAIVLLLLVVLVVFIIKGLNNNLVVTKYEFATSKVDRTIKVAIITDLHSCDYGENQNDLLKKIEHENPDLVLLVGDIVDDKLPEQKAFIVLKQLGIKYPSYYVTGNHEMRIGCIDQVKNKVKEQNVTVLSGEVVETIINHNKIMIKGIDDPEIGRVEYERQLNSLKGEDESDAVIILLAHRPERIDAYNKIEHDLVISGHVHGGHWRIPGIIPGFFAPQQGIFPKYTSGFYKLENSTMLVSRGLSRENIKIPRFYNPPEVIFLKLSPEQNQQL